MPTLLGCQATFVPPWLIRIISEKNLPIGTLGDIDKLSHILTDYDLKNYLTHQPQQGLVALGGDVKAILLALSKSVTISPITGDVVPLPMVHGSAAPVEYNRSFYDNSIDCTMSGGRYVDGMDIDVNLFVIDDRHHVAMTAEQTYMKMATQDLRNPQNNQKGLRLGISLTAIPTDSPVKVTRSMMLDRMIATLCKYYGVCTVANTPLVKGWIESK